PRVVPNEGRQVGEGERGLPEGYDLVHAASVEVGADGPLEVVDEGVDLLVRLGPVEVAVLVGHAAVERLDRRVDQLGHGEPSLDRPTYRAGVTRRRSSPARTAPPRWWTAGRDRCREAGSPRPAPGRRRSPRPWPPRAP